MPSMANITVKKNDGTTDATYTALTPSAGDKVSAQWRNNSQSTIAANRAAYALKAERTTSGIDSSFIRHTEQVVSILVLSKLASGLT